MKVFLTGANGFVGTHLTRDLLDIGYDVLCGVRNSEAVIPWAECVSMGDLGDLPGDFSKQLKTCSALVHLAGFAHRPSKRQSDKERCMRVNVEGSRRIFKSALEAGVKKIIYVSSVKAFGDSFEIERIHEELPDSPRDAYGRSKLMAEELGMSMASHHGAVFIAIRPTLVYGPGVKANFRKLIKLADSSIPLPFKGIENRRSICFVGNLCSAIIACLNHGSASSGKYYVADSTEVSTGDLVTRIRKLLGKEDARLISVPLHLDRLLKAIPFTSNWAGKLWGNLAVSTEKLQREVGWMAPFATDIGLEQTVAWHRSSTLAKDQGDLRSRLVTSR